MAQLIKNNFRIEEAKGFRNVLDVDSVYLWFGRSTAWTDENTPDTPVDSVSYSVSTRTEMLGMKKVTKSNTCFVIPRVNWTTSTVYDEYSDTDSALFTKQFYVMNSSYNVYKCLDNNGGVVSTAEPNGTLTSSFQTGDGYVWKFMYNLSTSIATDFLTESWLPVPTETQRTTFQISVEDAAVYSVGTPIGGHGFSAVEELGSKRVILSQKFSGTESGVLPVTSYRQFGLVKNPLLLADDSIATGSVYSLNESDSLVDTNSGQLLLIENRTQITRSADQAESIKLIVVF